MIRRIRSSNNGHTAFNFCFSRPTLFIGKHHTASEPNLLSLFINASLRRETAERPDLERGYRTKEGRATYSKRLGIVEPVFGNIRTQKGMARFTLRGKKKVDIHWTLYCLVHNLEKESGDTAWG